MSKDLTNSSIERQNILNNKYVLQRIQEYIGFTGMFFEGKNRFTKKNGRRILTKGKLLKEFKLQFVHLINEANKTPQLGLFNFRSFLNLAMLRK